MCVGGGGGGIGAVLMWSHAFHEDNHHGTRKGLFIRDLKSTLKIKLVGAFLNDGM